MDKQVINSLKHIKKFIYDVADTGLIKLPTATPRKWDSDEYIIAGGSFIANDVLDEVLDEHPSYKEKYLKFTRNDKCDFLRAVGCVPGKNNLDKRGWIFPPLQELRNKLLNLLRIVRWKWEKVI